MIKKKDTIESLFYVFFDKHSRGSHNLLEALILGLS